VLTDLDTTGDFGTLALESSWPPPSAGSTPTRGLADDHGRNLDATRR
jgi:hypothetical protein